jgi:REP element-mobilizing transposase RayT
MIPPLYPLNSADPAFCLRYSWTGFPSAGRFVSLPEPTILDRLASDWEKDGMRLLEHNWSDQRIQLTFSSTPVVAPVQVASRAKGRLQHALRKAGRPQRFSRKLSVRSVGNNTTRQVEAYIRRQVPKESFIDPRFADLMRQFTVCDSAVDLSKPDQSARGCYWYNLHVVLVVVDRYRICDLTWLGRTRDGCVRIAEKKKLRIAALSIMPDHLHLSLRGTFMHSPAEIANWYQNNLAFIHGQQLIWKESYYVGTFSEYDMGAIRQNRGKCG